jgi:hypothetical protein
MIKNKFTYNFVKIQVQNTKSKSKRNNHVQMKIWKTLCYNDIVLFGLCVLRAKVVGANIRANAILFSIRYVWKWILIKYYLKYL